LHQRLIRRLNDEIRAGKYTERALARRAGLSQPHVHNLLKGIRSPTAESADAMLRASSAGICDLIEQPQTDSAGPTVSIAFLRGAVGPGGRWDDQAEGGHRAQVPCKQLLGISQPAIVRILPDDQMGGIVGHALVDLEVRNDAAFPRRGLYVLVRMGEARLRHVRAGRDLVYFATSATLNRPCEWESAARDADLDGIVRARVCYLEETSASAASL
jgi:hypothetical protein